MLNIDRPGKDSKIKSVFSCTFIGGLIFLNTNNRNQRKENIKIDFHDETSISIEFLG